MVRIIYHSADFDGHCSGAIARYYFEHEMAQPFTMHPYNYNQPFPFSEFPAGDELYFLDVSYQPNADMFAFQEKYGWKVYICDHHKTTVDSELKNYISGGILTKEYSGCELTWKYFFPEREMPEVVHLLGRYDTWDNKDADRWNNIIVPFQMGFNLLPTNPLEDEAFNLSWLPLFYGKEHPDFVNDMIYKGKIILQYQDNMNKRLMKWLPEELEFNGYRAIVANNPLKNSEIFKSIWDEEKYDIMIFYSKSKYNVGVSLFTTKTGVDCSALAKKYGGGGHEQAAGFGADRVEIKDGKIEFIL